eukprot:11824065-Ditylum_brightwellii.AAC.1
MTPIKSCPHCCHGINYTYIRHGTLLLPTALSGTISEILGQDPEPKLFWTEILIPMKVTVSPL